MELEKRATAQGTVVRGILISSGYAQLEGSNF